MNRVLVSRTPNLCCAKRYVRLSKYSGCALSTNTEPLLREALCTSKQVRQWVLWGARVTSVQNVALLRYLTLSHESVFLAILLESQIFKSVTSLRGYTRPVHLVPALPRHRPAYSCCTTAVSASKHRAHPSVSCGSP